MYSARFGVEGFPCRHIPCLDQLTWPPPIVQAFDEIDRENQARIETVQFEWLFPDSTQKDIGVGVMSEGEQSECGDGVFLFELARLHGPPCQALRFQSSFHVYYNGVDESLQRWNESAKTGRIQLHSLPVPV
jgi:hypothetical protein